MPAIPRPAQDRINSWRAAAAELDAKAAQIGATMARADTVARTDRVQLVINSTGALTAIGFTDAATSVSQAALGSDVLAAHRLAVDYLWQGNRGGDRSSQVDLLTDADPKVFDVSTVSILPAPLRPAAGHEHTSRQDRYDPATDGDYNLWMRRRLERVLAAAALSRVQLEELRGQGGNDAVRIEVDHQAHPVSVQFRSGLTRLTPAELAERFTDAYAAARADFRAQADELYARLEQNGPEHG